MDNEFGVKVKESNLHSLDLPANMYKHVKCVPNGNTITLIRNTNNASFSVTLDKIGQSAILRGGWNNFIESNDIQIDDILVIRCWFRTFYVTVIKSSTSTCCPIGGNCELQQLQEGLAYNTCNRPSLFVVTSDRTIENCYMHLPRQFSDKFLQHFRGLSQVTITFGGQKSYNVRLYAQSTRPGCRRCFFGEGFHGMVVNEGVLKGDLLVFDYSGGSPLKFHGRVLHHVLSRETAEVSS